MIRRRKVLSLGVCLVIVALIASVISGCAGPSNGNGDGDGDGEPIYGGELRTVVLADPVYFDDAIGPHYTTTSTQECLWSGNWARGPAGGYGSNDLPWIVVTNRLSDKIGYVAESYEIHDDYLIFNIRPGMKFHDKYPANGRDVTADDVLLAFERQMTLDTAYFYKSYPDMVASMDVYKVDDDTVRVDCSSTYMPELLTLIDFMYIYPKEVIDVYGDANDWQNCIGTGAFTLEEYVEGSYLYFERFDDWWMTYPEIGSPSDGDDIPYIDGYRVYIQPDQSTQDALFSTGQIDRINCDTSRAQALKDLPGVQYRTYIETASCPTLYMRLDKEDKPWADKRVRQAMQLAVNSQQLVDELYGGEAEILTWPVWDTPEMAGAYVPLEDLDDDMIEVLPDTEISVADLFGHDLELAQALMDAAGYSEGFTAQLDVYNTQFNMDSVQAVVAMLEDINITLTINPMDYGTWTSAWFLKSYPDIMNASFAGVATYFKGINWQGTGMFNTSKIDDPVLNDYRMQMLEAYPDEDAVDAIHREMIPYLLEQCYCIQQAGALSYVLWHPWLKNYSGEGGIGYYKLLMGDRNAFIWVDEELREEMYGT